MKPLRLSTRLQPEQSPCDGPPTWTSLVRCMDTAPVTYMHICMYLGMLAAPVLQARQGTRTMLFQMSQYACTLACLRSISSQRQSVTMLPWHEVALHLARGVRAGEGNSIGISASESAATAAAAALAATADPVRRMKKRKRDAKRNGQVGVDYLLPPGVTDIIWIFLAVEKSAALRVWASVRQTPDIFPSHGCKR